MSEVLLSAPPAPSRISFILKNNISNILTFRDFYRLVYPFNRLFRGPQTLHLWGGTKILVRDNMSKDISVIKEVLGLKTYRLNEIELGSQYPLNIIDIGANIGTFSIAAARRWQKSEITAYEPFVENFELLNKNAQLNRIHDFKSIKAAVAGTDARVLFQDKGLPNALHIVKEGGVEVAGVSLNTVCKSIEKCDLMKIDVEGSEYEVLENTTLETFRKIKRILVELHGDEDKKQAMRLFLESNGYRTEWWGVGLLSAIR